jgi:nucleotide-binding universal stress UspA family protein
MKKLVVPYDFSAIAECGIDLAVKMADKFGSDIDIMHVIPKQAGYSQKYGQDIYKKVEDQMTALAASVQDRMLGGGSVDFKIAQGKVHRQINKYVATLEKAMIVTSTHGESGLAKMFIGSNAYKIISETTVPVLTIRDAKPPTKIRKIVMPIDLTISTRQKVPITIKFAKTFGAEIHVIALASTRDDLKVAERYAKQVIEYIKEEGVECSGESLLGDNLTDIAIGYAKGDHADMISIMTEQDEDLSNLILGSYVHQMLNKTDIPVLSVTPKDIYKSNGFHTQG